MTAPLTLHELTGSPNSVKVRIGLGLKGLEYERVPLQLDGYPGNRAKLVEVSGQPRAPVLVHGKTVVFDSSAILRYLDANFRDTAPLYSTDHATMGQIEEWELWARTDLSRPVGTMYGQCFAPSPDPEVCRQACAMIHEVTGEIESRLAESPYLVRDTPSGADLATAPAIALAMLPAAAAASSPIAAVFHEHFHLGDGRDRTREWVGKLLAHDVAQPR